MAFSSWYYGMDDLSGSWFPCTGNEPNFYLGRIGHETSAGDLTYFDTTAAEKVGTEHTFAIRDVAGPGTNGPKPAGMSPEDWGSAQGHAFSTAYTKYSKYIAGQTWFGDIEIGNHGWITGTTPDDNTATLFGFLDAVAGGDCPATCADAADEFNATYADMTVGGYKVMIWQYGSNACGETQDLDITPYAGYQTGKWTPTT